MLYRKYRPGDFSEVIGQEHVVQTLKNAVAKGMVAHAYLFAGPRGTGKTTLARILAKAVNCEKPKQGAPCNECERCKAVASGRAMDVVEIDAASNRGIDEIRELRDGIRQVPSFLPYKVYIIDEAHQLTKEAFNALLKMLEEPPAHAIFVLATTVADKMPATILSRVQRFDFKKLSAEQILQKLTRITKEEKRTADEAALRMVAHAAEGGLRDAESMLTQVFSFTHEKLTPAVVEQALGIVGVARTAAFVDTLLERDMARVIVVLNEMYRMGASMEEFLKSLTNYARAMMLLRLDATLRQAAAPELTDEQFSVMVAQCKKLKDGEAESLMAALIEAHDMTKKTSIATLPLELAILKYFQGVV
ncbi:MAG: DNA polymerase III subunit gamma/tau [Patescibacteria group bacterium]